MSDRDRAGQTLALLARRGTYEVLLAIQARGGTASFAQIATGMRRPVALLREMAAEGLLVAQDGGSLDDEPCGKTLFCLTVKGEAIFGHLLRLQQWLTSRRSTTSASRPRQPGPQ
ncbi:hypothetical protein OG958_21495 [Micromonospora sp. NBC_01813]|nr:hypothetical protein OG958_21495 [Micromonospora sp. NBC_01813]